MKKFFEKIFRLPLEGKLSSKVTDEVENTLNEKHLIRQACLTPSPRGEGSRRGFTIVELVIALSVIVIVSGISIGVVAVNNKTYGETIDMIEATNIAENAIECFRYAVNNPDDIAGSQVIFDPAFEKCFDPIKRENGEINILKEFKTFNGNTNVDTYTVTDGRITVVIVLKDSEDDDEIYESITITAHNNDGADDLFDGPVTYTVR